MVWISDPDVAMHQVKRYGAEAAADVAGALLAAHVIAVDLAPAFRHAAEHAHGDERLGIAPAALTLARELAPGADLVAAVLPGNTASAALFERAL